MNSTALTIESNTGPTTDTNDLTKIIENLIIDIIKYNNKLWINLDFPESFRSYNINRAIEIADTYENLLNSLSFSLNPSSHRPSPVARTRPMPSQSHMEKAWKQLKEVEKDAANVQKKKMIERSISFLDANTENRERVEEYYRKDIEHRFANNIFTQDPDVKNNIDDLCYQIRKGMAVKLGFNVHQANKVARLNRQTVLEEIPGARPGTGAVRISLLQNRGTGKKIKPKTKRKKYRKKHKNYIKNIKTKAKRKT